MLAKQMNSRLHALGLVERLKRVRSTILDLEAEEKSILTQLVCDLGVAIGTTRTFNDLGLWLNFPGVEYSLESAKYKVIVNQLGMVWDPVVVSTYTQMKVNKELYQICHDDAPSEIMTLLDSCIKPRYPDIKYKIITTKN